MQLSSELTALLRGSLDSVEKLQLALELWRAGRRVSVSRLGALLLFDGETLRRLVDELIADGLVERCPDYSLQLTRRAHERDVSSLLARFGEDRASIVAVLWSLSTRSRVHEH